MSVDAQLSTLSREIASLRDTVSMLGQGLSQMLETQHTHTAMLQQILVASASSASDESSLSDMIGQLIDALKRQCATLGEVKASIEHLPNHVGMAVAGAVRDILGQL